MKRILLLALLMTNAILMQATPNIDRIEPQDWYVGLKDATLQLMIYGENIRESDVSADYSGVRIDSIVRLASPNYLLVYLDLKGAKAGEMTLTFRQNGKQRCVKYQLKQRERAGADRQGFTNADVLYMLMPDRFASSGKQHPDADKMNAYVVNRNEPSLRHGGDLEGLRQHLDYFTELGVTALWFTPVLENNSPDRDGFSTYHGYATTNYYRVDPRFGTNADYRRLIDEAHARGLKVVMDMIFNHCGFEHPWVKDMPSADWFNLPEWLEASQGKPEPNSKFLQTSYKLTPLRDPYASKIDTKETVEGWFVPTMPDLNQHNPHVMRYLIQNSVWWIETANIDGIRMDTYPYAYADGMAEWMKTLDTEYPHFNVVGETWVTEPAYTASWQKNSRLAKKNTYLKTVMDFAFFDRLNRAKSEETDDFWEGYNRLYNTLAYDYLYEDPTNVMAFIDNHDTDRFLGKGQDTLALKQALALLLTVRRIPQLYYGTEILMNGTKEVTDGNVRKDFPGGFPGDKHNAFTANGRTRAEQNMFAWLSRVLHWRQNNPAIISGRQTQFIPCQGVYVIARTTDDRCVLTIINGRNHEAELQVARYAEVIPAGATAIDITTGRSHSLATNVKLRPRQTMILDIKR